MNFTNLWPKLGIMTDPSPTATSSADTSRQLLEEGKRLSECLMWPMLQKFYDESALDSWNDVPYYPTSNAYIGEIYADLIIAFLLDHYDELNKDEPVYIVELASGTGFFGYFFIRELVSKVQYFEKLKALKLQYVMTDFVDSIVKTWRENEMLAPFDATGVLDYAIFRPEDDTQLTLRKAGITLNADTIKNPIIALANYFFDSIPNDIFRIEDGRLQEGRMRFSRSLEDVDPESPVTMNQLIREEYYVDTELPYYPQGICNQILDDYQRYFQNGSILFPISALKCLCNLKTMSGGNLVLISSDKGYTHIDYMDDHFEHGYVTHGGAFSFMVNYNAICRFFLHQGGHVYTNTDEPLTTVLCVMTHSMKEPQHAAYMFQEALRKRNTVNGFFHSHQLMYAHTHDDPEKLWKSYWAFLQLSNYDHYLLYTCIELLNAMVQKDEEKYGVSIASFLEKIEEANYDLYPKAVYCNAMWYERQQLYPEALELMKDALALDPESKQIQESITRIEGYLRGGNTPKD